LVAPVIKPPVLHRLANGVRVVCDPMPGLETLALSVVAGRGSRWETPEQSGWAHLLEHMVFKGAGPRTARGLVEAIEDQGGSINAATGYERTSFQVRALKGGLPLAVEVLSDLVLRPAIDGEELKREIGVVCQEIAEAADTPDDRVFDLAQSRAFDGQSLGRPILGLPDTIGAATQQTLAAFRADLYAPDQLVISAAGAVNEAELLGLVESAFGGATAGAAAAPGPARFVGGAAHEIRRLEQAHLVLMLPGMGARDPDYFASRIFAEALGGGMSSRLFQEAREALGLAYAIDAYAESYADAGIFGIYAGTSAGDAAKTAQVTAQQIRALASGPAQGELERAKAQLKAALFMARESPLARAEQAAGQTLLFDRLFTAAELAEAVDSVTPDDLRRVGARMLQPGVVAGAVLGPKGAMKATDAFASALSA
jgi:predicted Zn-dependent peptidase